MSEPFKQRMDQKEFKLFYKNKSPLLYTYVLSHVIDSNVADDLMQNIFARFYRTRLNIPSSLSREKWLLLITKKFMIEYFTWRTTEEGQQVQGAGLSSYQCSHLMEEHNAQLRQWVDALSEADQALVNDNILSELPPPPTRFNLMDRIRTKIKETEAEARKDTTTVDYLKDKIKKIKEDSDGNQSPKE
jgi:DNA-directed RNA polymerase specialized sigma24 family protein